MPSRLAAALDSANPMQGGLSEHTLMVRSFRLTCLLAAVLLPVFGWFFHASGVPVVDPWPVRIAGSLLMTAGGVLTYLSEWFRAHLRHVYRAFTYGATVYFAWLVWANSLAPDYAVGYLFVFVMSALTYSLSHTTPAPFGRYLAFSTVVACVSVLMTRDPAASPSVFLLTTGSLTALVYVAVVARMATHEALVQSRERLAAAEALAGTGSWDHDLRTGHRLWSDGLYRLLGAQPPTDGTSAPSLAGAVHADDREAVEAARARLLASGTRTDFRFRVARPTGEMRSFRAVVRLARDRSGRPLRFTGAVVDVTEHDRREADLRRARDLAEASDRAKSAFLANMSHEIRTPLTAIIGYAQLLGEETGDEHRDLVAPIETGGVRLLDTLNSVLDLARMESGAAATPRVAVDAGAEARAAVAMLRGRAEAQGLALTAHVEDGVPAVLADRGGLGRVLANLVSNAVKFTDAGGVTVAVRRDGGRVALSVSDTGCGMDDAFLATLYEPFQQASTGWARSHEGTGLGLTITRRLVDDMGGEITVESAPGEGTTFTVRLDAAPEAPRVSARERAAA